MTTGRVLGVDGCPAGWVGVAVELAGSRAAAYLAPTMGELLELVERDGAPSVVGVDMPIGLAERGARQADGLAKKALGALHASVFPAPVRAALDEPDHAGASARNRELTGKGLSIQSYGLLAKIRELDRWRADCGCRLVEVHPELCFARLAGAPVPERKKTWAGAVRRRRLLAEHGIVLPDDLGRAGLRTPVDDVLDAAAVAWTARRVALGQAGSLPDPPEILADGSSCAIWT